MFAGSGIPGVGLISAGVSELFPVQPYNNARMEINKSILLYIYVSKIKC